MSTCIANGYILETSNSKKVNKVNDRLRVIFNQILKKQLIKNIVTMVSPVANYVYNPKSDCAVQDRFESYYECFEAANYELKSETLKSFIKNKIRQKEGSLFDLAKGIIECLSTQSGNNLYTVTSEKIYFKSVGKVTLYFFAVSSPIAEEFDRLNKRYNLLKEYQYYDNTDKPDAVTTKAWKHRAHMWNRALEGKMNVSEIFYKIPLNAEVYGVDVEDLLPVLPDEHERLINLYKKSRRTELSNKFKDAYVAKHGTNIPTSAYSNFFFDSCEIVMDEIQNGVYKTSQKHLDMMITQEEYISKIFHDSGLYFSKEVES